MKTIYRYIAPAAVALVAALATSCNDEFARPPIVAPQSPMVGTENTTIAQLKDMYWRDNSNNYATEVGSTAEGANIIIKARVISSDVSSCLYQYLYVQDETGAMTIAARQLSSSAKLGTQYGLGQEVYIDATGLYAGRYAGLFQLGAKDASDDKTTFLDNAVLLEHVSANGLGDPSKIDVWNVTIPELTAALASETELMKYQAHAVRLADVHFTSAGQPFIPVANQDANITFADAAGQTMIIRMNRYCTFGNTKIPGGTGTITGELGYFNNTWQLVINSISDLEGFDWEAGEEPEKPVEATNLLQANFDASTDIPAGWKALKTKGNKDWYVRNFNDNNYATMTGYQGTAPFDAWLISPGVDLNKAAEKVASFETQVNGYGSTTTTLKAYILDSQDPATAKLTELAPALPTAPASGYSEWLSSGNLDLSAFSGVVYIGFRYEATTDNNYATWCVDNVVVGKKVETGDTPVPPAGDETTLFSSLSEASSELPAGWTIQNTTVPDGVSAIWAWKVYNEKGYLNGSGYANNKANAAEALAISPVIDLAGASDIEMVFDHAAKFQTTLRTLCGVQVREENAKEWTALTIPAWPEAGAWNFASSGKISLDAFAGKKIQVAFKYGSTADGADTWEIKNLVITGKK